jgi:predicted dehydrogenase
MAGKPFAKRNPRIAIIGTGGRGTSLLGNLLASGGQIVALCDIVAEKAEAASAQVVKAGRKQPELYNKGPYDYERLLQRSDIDLVIVATPWLWHAPQAITAMKEGKDVVSKCRRSRPSKTAGESSKPQSRRASIA